MDEPRSKKHWHYTHLLSDPDFNRTMDELDKRLVLQLEDGSELRPRDTVDFHSAYIKYTFPRQKKYAHLNPHAAEMNELIDTTMHLWHISSRLDLLSYLIKGEMTPVSDNVAVAYDDVFGGFHAYLPADARKSDTYRLWIRLQEEQKKRGLKPSTSKDTQNSVKTEIAYQMWRMRSNGKTWTQVVKAIDEKYDTTYNGDIKSAQNLMKTHGYGY